MPAKLRYKKALKQGLIISGALALAGLVYLGFWYYQNKFGRHGCTEEVMERAAIVLGPTTREPLRPIVEELEKDPKFVRHPECVYIALTYYLNIGNVAKSEEYLTILKEKHDSQDYNSKLGNNLDSIEELEVRLDYIKKLKAQYETNFTTFPVPQ